MKKLYYDDIPTLLVDVASVFDGLKENNDYEDVSIIANYDEAKEIVKELLMLGFEIGCLDLTRNGEVFIISICNIETEDGEIWCEPFENEKGDYLYDDSTVTYVIDNCPSDVYKNLEGDEIYTVCIGVEEPKPCKKCENEIKSTETYKVNGKPVSKDEFLKAHDKIEELYLDGIRDMLLTHRSIVNELDAMRGLFRF